MSVPVQSIEVLDANIKVKIDDLDIAMQTQNFSLNFEKSLQAAKLELFVPDLDIKKHGSEAPIQFGISSRIVIEKNAVEISALKITQNKNFLIVRGVARGAITDFSWSSLNGRTLSHLNLEEVAPVIKAFTPNLTIPALKGILNFEFLAQNQRGKEPVFSGEIETKEAQIGKINAGNIFTKIKFTEGTISTSDTKLTHDAGIAKIEDLVFNIEKNMKFSLRLVVEKIELRKLLLGLGLRDPPITAELKGRIPCDGELKPEFHMECAGELESEKFRIYTHNNSKGISKTVVELSQFKVTSTLKMNQQKIIFPQALLSLGNSTGQASGEVDFEKGFNFNFASQALNFTDVKSLADLKYDGKVSLSGSTKGNGDVGVIAAQIHSDEFWFEDFGLGYSNFGFRYQNDHLYFDQIKGGLNQTTYNGDVVVNLGEKEDPPTIQAKLAVPRFDLADLLTLFSRKAKLPFEASGLGSADIEAHGLIRLDQLTYNLKSNVKSGNVANDSFKDFRFNIHGINGHAFADEISLKKGDGLVTMKGDVLPSGVMNLAINSYGLRVSDLDAVHSFSAGIDGKLGLEMTLKDQILHPTISLNSNVTSTTINQQPVEDSSFSLFMNPSILKFQGQMFAAKIKSNLIYSFTENGPFSFKLDTSEFDFSNLLGIAQNSGLRKDYETSLTAHIDLAARGGGFWQSTGVAYIPKFYVRHGTTQMRNIKPISVKFNDGLVNIESLKIEGDNTDISVTGNRNKNEILNFNVNGRVDLSLLTFLTPFFKDMGGILTISTQIGGKIEHPDLLGSAFISKGYFKVDVLPHPFENISTDLLFSQSRIVVNKIKGTFAGGDISAAGSVTFRDKGDIPVEINGDLMGATINIPEGLSTHGNFHFGVLGNWFPYLIKGDYNIESGLYTKNFGADTNDGTLKRSIYLPTIISKKDFAPFELNINTLFPKTISVKNNIMDAEIRGTLLIKGDPAHPNLEGDINALPNGKVFFRETAFSISAAKLKLDSRGEGNSTVYTVGTTRVRDWDISLLVQGNLREPKISLTSSPPLTEQNIVSLLALGLTDDKLETTKSSDALNLQASQAGSALLSANPLQKELKKKFGVNVRISQTVDDTRNVVTPQVVAEKQWTPQVLTSVSRTIGDRVSRNVNIEYKLNRHFSILGSYEGRDFDNLATTNTPTQVTTSTDIFGLDLQFQVEYR